MSLGGRSLWWTEFKLCSEGGETSFNLKAWRVKNTKVKLTLGRDVGMKEVGLYSQWGLVGKFGYWAMGIREIHRWVEETWSPMLGYSPVVFIPTKGWFCFCV
jgi:hypothetical protein